MTPTTLALTRQATMRCLLALPLLAIPLSLGGCFGIGMVAHKAFGDKNNDGGSIVAAQEQALTAAHGGAPGAFVAWNDKKTGTQGALQRIARADTADGCQQYNQVLNVGSEATRGTVKACPHTDGTWHLQNQRGDVASR